MEKKQSLINTIKTTKYMLSLVWNRDRLYVFFNCILGLLNSIFFVPLIIMPGLIINELTGAKNISVLLLYVSTTIIIPVLNDSINIIFNKIIQKRGLKIVKDLEVDFYRHISKLDYELLENPNIHNMQNRSQVTLSYGALRVVDHMKSLISGVVNLIAIFSIIMTLNVFMIVLIIIIVYVNSLVTKWLNKKKYLFEKDFSKRNRQEFVVTSTFTDIFYAKEMRLYNSSNFFIKKFIELKELFNEQTLDNQKNDYKARLGYSAITFVQQVFLYAYLIYSILNRGLSVGSMTIYISAVSQSTSAISSLINTYMALAKDGLSVQDLMDFMKIPLRQYNSGDKIPIFNKKSVIEFKNVSFKYPGSQNYAIKNLNITIYGNEKLCIVGTNGSGKSTFIKLLTRLYYVTEGKILLNGVDIYEYDYEKYQRLFSVVLQDYVLYSMSLKENILMADEYNEKHFNEVCVKSNLTSFIDKLPKGLETQITTALDENGIYPSGGECQRLAIARAVYHGGEIYLLDEPTASLDPVAEQEIYTQFNNTITDNCAILITHRLSAVQLVDKVAVFENGCVAEYGTHNDLYAKNGIYTEMFNKQAQFYKNSINCD